MLPLSLRLSSVSVDFRESLRLSSVSVDFTESLRFSGPVISWSPSPPAQAGSPRAGCPGRVPSGSEWTPKGGDATASVGNCLQGLTRVAVKKFFLVFRFNCTFCSLCPLPLVLPAGAAEESPAPSSSFPPIRCTSIRSPLSLLQAEQSQLSQPLRT